MKPKKELGQNFLQNQNVVNKMISALEATENDLVIEIGPGLGALTDALLQKKCKVKAVEFDVALAEKLKKRYEGNPHIEVIQKSILDWLPDFDSQGQEFKIIGSLPYYITSPIIHGIIHTRQLPTKCVFLVQKEVAERISAKKPKNTYLSTFVQSFCNVQYLGKVDKEDFYPIPQVDGGILEFLLIDPQKIGHEQKRRYEGFLHKSFANPRKMLNKAFSPQELETAKINGRQRPQDLDANEWREAFEFLV